MSAQEETAMTMPTLRTPQQTDDCISDHGRRIQLLEGRIGSYADAELAYRAAAKDIADLRAEHVREHSQMLTSAKNILESAVTRATERFAEPLAVVGAIRQEQIDRANERRVLDKYYRHVAWGLGKVAAVCGALFTLAKIYMMLTGK